MMMTGASTIRCGDWILCDRLTPDFAGYSYITNRRKGHDGRILLTTASETVDFDPDDVVDLVFVWPEVPQGYVTYMARR